MFRAALLLLTLVARPVLAGETTESAHSPSAARGVWLLLNKAYLPPDFDQETFDELWKCWEEPLRSQAAEASPAERRRMAYGRYGLTAQPNDPLERPLQYVVDRQGNWTMNCLACHQGQVAGKVILGVPNSNYALETLTEDVRRTKIRLGKKLTHMDVGSLIMPLGTSNGTTNAVMFGVALWNCRDEELNIVPDRPRVKMMHHDHDAPPLWNVKKKKRLYCDGFAPKSHRALMQFVMVEQNGPAKFRRWENEFRDILAFIESLDPPEYPFEIDRELAAAGERAFHRACARCHGTYGPGGSYPERIVPIEEVGTDAVRLASLSQAHREKYGRSWIAEGGKTKTLTDPGGYVAPPLDGVWASAPYFHNGSVPTLWHVLHPEQRPAVWRRTPEGYDRDRVGLEVAEFDRVPDEAKTPAQLRQYFNTQRKGKSAAGHDFPSRLSEAERRAVLEYLKTL